jgi:hypothetical protein
MLFQDLEDILGPQSVFPFSRFQGDDGIINLFRTQDFIVKSWMRMNGILPCQSMFSTPGLRPTQSLGKLPFSMTIFHLVSVGR